MADQAKEFSLQHLLNFFYRRGGRYFYFTDNASFIKHSEQFANICFADDYIEIVLRDIQQPNKK